MTISLRHQKNRRLSPLLGGLIWPVVLLFFATSMIIYPREVFTAALRGLDAWWTVVFPALLPFFVVSELMMGLGLVDFLGVLLEPIMRPLFNVPGQGAFVLAVGYTSGAPIGSMLTAGLRRKGLCTRLEGERLMSFTSNASPLFMLVAVAVGMLHNPALGSVIAGAHYTANLILGIMLRFYGRDDPERSLNFDRRTNSLLNRAFLAVQSVRRQATEPPGKALGDAIRNSIQTLTTIGGFIILFSVLIQVLTVTGIIGWITGLLAFCLQPLGFPPDLIAAVASGLFEMTMGAKLSAETGASTVQQVMAVSLILGWSGLCVHAQVAGMIAGTDLRMRTFVLTRITHSILAALLAVLFLGPIRPAFVSAAHLVPVSPLAAWWNTSATALMMMASTILLLWFTRMFVWLCRR